MKNSSKTNTLQILYSSKNGFLTQYFSLLAFVALYHQRNEVFH